MTAGDVGRRSTRTRADVDGWAADVDALLAERAARADPPAPPLPAQLSVSSLVELGRDPDAALQRLRRRLPTRPDPHALLGTAFHDWVQRFYGAERLFDLDDLPGAVDRDCRATPKSSPSCRPRSRCPRGRPARPSTSRCPFDMVIGGHVVRGRIDAVFADADGGTTVVDWKTGEPPDTPEAKRHAAIQLAVYRLAWAALHGCPVDGARGVPLRAVRADRHPRVAAGRRRPRRAAARLA